MPTLARRAARLAGAPSLLVFLGVVVPAMLVYALDAARSLTGEDAGDLLAGAAGSIALTGWLSPPGVVHPPGYPLWTMLGWVAAHLGPVGSIPFRVTLLSGLCAALAAAIVARTVFRLSASLGGSLAAGWLVAFSRDIHSQAVIPEVYTLNLFFTALALDLLVRWDRERESRLLLGLALVWGLGMANHHTMGPVGALMAFWVLLRQPSLVGRPGLILRGAALVALGLTPYLAMMGFARLGPAMNWGNPSTLGALRDHVTRAQYTFQYTEHRRSWLRLLGQVRAFLPFLASQWSRPLLLLVLPGAWLLWRRARALLALLAAIFVLTTVGFMVLLNYDIERQVLAAYRLFFLPAYLVLAMVLGLGVAVLLPAPEARPGWRALRVALVAGAALAGLFPLGANLRDNDKSHYPLVEGFTRAMLAEFERGAVFIPSGGDDSSFPLFYFQQVLGERTDVVLADRFGYIDPPLLKQRGITPSLLRSREAWQRRPELFQALLRTLKGTPVYVDTPFDASFLPGVRIVQTGFLHRVLWPGERPPLGPEEVAARLRRLASGGIPGLGTAPRDETHDILLSVVFSSLAEAELALGRKELALEAIRRAEEAGAGVKEAFNNLGSILADAGLLDEAIPRFRAALAFGPGYPMAARNLERALAIRARWGSAPSVWGRGGGR